MLIITGSIAYDYLMKFPGKFSENILPEHTHNINLSFLVDSFDKRRGGTAGNVSYTLGLLGTPHKLYAHVGSDFDDYKNAFEDLDIDLRNVKVINNDHTSTAFALADRSQNQIWGFYNGAGAKNVKLNLKKIAGKKDLVFAGPQGEATLSFVRQCVELKLPYMFDPGFLLPVISDEQLFYGLTNSEYITCNEYEHNLMKSRMKDWEKITKQKILITTLGEKGAVIEAQGKTYQIKPAKAKKVATTAGAGDAWRGGFLAGVARNFDLQTCGQMGAVAGVYAVEHVGTQEHVYTKSAFAKRYKDAYNESLKL